MKITRKRMTSMFLVVILLLSAQAVPVSAKEPILGTTVTNQNFFETSSCEYDGKIYYALANELYSVKKDGTDIKQVCVVKDESCKHPEITNLTVLGDYIYAIFKPTIDAPDGRLIRMKPDGAGYKIYKGEKYDGFNVLCAVNGKLYYSKHRKNSYIDDIYSMNSDGSEKTMLVKGADNPIIDGKTIYYKLRANYDGKTEQKIFRCDMNGKNVKEIVSTKQYICHFSVDGDYFYYVTAKGLSNQANYNYYRKNLKTSSLKKVYVGHWPMGIYAKENNLYILDENTDNLIKLNTSTGKSKVIKKKVIQFLGVFDDVMVMETTKQKDGWCHILLLDCSTGKEIATLGKVTGFSVQVDAM